MRTLKQFCWLSSKRAWIGRRFRRVALTLLKEYYGTKTFPFTAEGCRSEYQLQAELNLPGRGGERGEQSRRGADIRARKNSAVRRAQVGPVEQIEKFHPELQIHALR